ncbi:MAG: nucleotidyltransferase domain-containing protein [Nitrososphaerales archaeon]
MRTPAPSLLPLLRSGVQGGLLALLYLHPDHSYSLADASRRLNVSAKAVHMEANRLGEAGFIEESRLGNLRLLKANTSSILFQPLAQLLALTYGPLPVLSDLLSRMDQIDDAYIYGSWARRYHGESGPIPNDVDVVVIGSIDKDDVYEMSRSASALLGREVNAVRLSRYAWDKSSDVFVSNLRTGALVDLFEGARQS